jgi:uncharacterized Zn-finger protein
MAINPPPQYSHPRVFVVIRGLPTANGRNGVRAWRY